MGLTQIAGCGGSAGGICEAVCDCTGCSDSEQEDCVDDFEELEEDAADDGCDEEFDELADCAEEKLECDDDSVDLSRCDDEFEDLAECLDEPPNIAFGDPCAQAAQVCGAEASEPVACTGTVACFASCIVAANACDADTVANCAGGCDGSSPGGSSGPTEA